MVKPKWGADSIGMRQIGRAELSEVEPGTLIQPRIDFVYEVSFYFIGRTVQYALYAPDPDRRWDLGRTRLLLRTESSRNDSSTGTTSTTESRGWTHAAPSTERCCWSSSKT